MSAAPKKSSLYSIPSATRDAGSLVFTFYLFSTFLLTFLHDHPLLLTIILVNVLWFAQRYGVLPQLKMYKSMVLYISLFLFIINILLNPAGDLVLWRIFSSSRFFSEINITVENIVATYIGVIRLSIVLLVFGLFNLLVSNDDLMGIMLKIRIPHKIVLLITLSLKFFPLLTQDITNLQEIQNIQQGQASGQSQKILGRLRSKINIILPLLTNSLERSIQIAQALEARAFGISKKRSSYFHYSFTFQDYASFLSILGASIIQIYLWVKGLIDFSVYPSFSSTLLSMTDIIIMLCILFFNVILIYIIFPRRRKQ
ncbi:MAG: energy-coupling factor transporter transmembrane component T [Promethearchaeota archaeon]